MNTSSNFSSRLSAGQRGEQRLKAHLEALGFCVMETGQQAWLLKHVHTALRFEHTDLMARAVRYQPDLLVYHPDFPTAYWEVKTNTTPGTPYFAVEVACYDEALARVNKGERVIFAFLEIDETWYVNWTQNLKIGRDMRSQRKQAKGSQTPYLLLTKASTLPLVDFLQQEHRQTCGKIGIWPTM